MNENPYRSPLSAGIGSTRSTDGGEASSERCLLGAVWAGCRIGAVIGGVIGVAAVIAVLWIGAEWGAIRDLLKGDRAGIASVVLILTLPTLFGAIGFGLSAAMRHLRRPRPPQTDEQQGPLPVDQRTVDG